MKARLKGSKAAPGDIRPIPGRRLHGQILVTVPGEKWILSSSGAPHPLSPRTLDQARTCAVTQDTGLGQGMCRHPGHWTRPGHVGLAGRTQEPENHCCDFPRCGQNSRSGVHIYLCLGWASEKRESPWSLLVIQTSPESRMYLSHHQPILTSGQNVH